MQSTLSANKFIRYYLFRLHFKGGLKDEDKTQIVQGWYYPGVYGLSDKVVLDFGIGSVSKNEFTEKPSSLRIDSYQQMKGLVFHLIRSLVILGKRTKYVNETNFRKLLKDDIETLEGFYKELV